MSLAAKLWLGFGLLMLALALSGLVGLREFQRIKHELAQVGSVAMPAQEAALELEINAGEGAEAVLAYLRGRDPGQLDVLADSAADFARYAAELERLAPSGEARRLAREVAHSFAQVQALGGELVRLADERHAALRAFRDRARRIDELIHNDLQAAINPFAPDALARMGAALDLEAAVNHAVAAVEGEVVEPDAAGRGTLQDALDDFKRLQALYRARDPSPGELAWLDRIGGEFQGLVASGQGVMSLTDRVGRRVGALRDLRQAIEARLDEDLQPMIQRDAAALAAHARASIRRSEVLLAVLILLAVPAAAAGAWRLSRRFVGPMGALLEGTRIVGEGKFGHRIAVHGSDEIAQLALAFNRMMDKLAASTARWRESEETLEQRVEERAGELARINADLENEIAARQHAEAALVKSEARFRDFAELGSDWCWEMDETLTFTYFSRDMLPATGMRFEDLIGKSRRDVMAPQEDPEVWREHYETLQARKPFRAFTYRLRTPEGRILFMRANGKPLFRSDGKFLGYRGTGSDVTAEMETLEALRAAVEQAQVANIAKSQFLANMSHELRTPLNAVIGFSEIIKDARFGPPGNPKYQAYAADIHEAGRHLLEVINGILDLSKVESGRDELCEEEVAPADVIRMADSLVRAHAERAGLDLEFDCPPDLPYLRADARKLKQILLNLLSNAIKFTERGGRVTVRVWCRPPGGHIFQISDTGIGIRLDELPKALSSFAQVDSKLSRKYEGTGLGLPLSKAYVEMHGGSLDLQSEPGVGTTVTVRFPAARIVRGAPRAGAAGAP